MGNRHLNSHGNPSESTGRNEGVTETPRAYQLEMLQSSLDGNAIVVMDTGSGKTLVAIRRIMIELERAKDSKIVWFLAPTVPLCIQQFEAICHNLPSASARLIIGSDNVERWSTQEIWDNVLRGHRITVSTHAILLDALTHGFVTMSRLSLLVFDEAHHCTGEHPGNKIMRDFYHPSLKSEGSVAVPHILGLTASPIMNSKVSRETLRLIESNLNAFTVSPRIHRDELRRYVHLPRLIRIEYDEQAAPEVSLCVELVQKALGAAEIGRDPTLIRILACSLAPKTKSRNQSEVKTLLRKADHIHSELGPWAAENYTNMVLAKLSEPTDRVQDAMPGWREDDGIKHRNILSCLPASQSIQPQRTHDDFEISPKAKKLIEFIISQQESKMSGIIFVDQRATAAMLQRLLSTHPDTKHLSYATFVGTSNPSLHRSHPSDIIDLNDQRNTLDDFRTKKCNVIIATSVLEEGIDISSCNLVVCYNKPANLKSFIQRRGRARERQSTFVLMLSKEDQFVRKKNWGALEADMIQMYQDQQRKLEEELHMEEVVDHGYRRFEVISTKALLTLESAIPHLNHFCAVLPACEYVDYRPVYIFHEDSESGLVKAEVILPNCLDPTVRQAFGAQYWHSEKQAKKDAAFEAYTTLYHMSLINDNLLPAPGCHQGLGFSQDQEPSSLILSESINPWADMARTWENIPNTSIYPTSIKIERPSEPPLQMILILPERLPTMSSCKLLRTSTRTYTASFENLSPQDLGVNDSLLATAREINYTILRSIHSPRMLQDRTDIVTIFVPALNFAELAEWKMANLGTESAVEAQRRFCPPARIARTPSLWNSPQFFERWLGRDALEVASPPRRRNFLGLENPSSVRRSKLYNKEPAAKIRSVAIENTTFDRLSPADAEFSLLVPSLLRHVEKYYVAGQLATSILSDVQFRDLSVVVEALSASSACDTNNYQRLEHIGDGILKFIIVSQLFAAHPNWHEGYLSQAKDMLVANKRLSRAAIRTGLDKYILSRPFAPRKWIPPYIPELLETQPSQKRSLSKKVLADVVEALIGAAFVDGGLRNATKCLQTFLPNVLTDTLQDIFLNAIQPDHSVSYQQQNFSDLQNLLNYQFRRLGFLVEAITHPSLTSDLSSSSYQRLEFLGDAVIDMLIVQRLASYNPALSHDRMHLIKSALTNANFQAFLCMAFSLEQEIFEVSEDTVRGEVVTVRLGRRVALCDFMRHQSAQIAKAREACVSRYQELASQISVALDSGMYYPWSLLARLEAPKYLADIVESVFGAVLVDSQGDLAMCEKLAERIGLMSYVSRMSRDDIDLRHPKNRLSDVSIGKGKVKYRIRRVEAPCQEFRCVVSVGDRVFGEVGGGNSREEVTGRAAEAAISALGKLDEGET